MTEYLEGALGAAERRRHEAHLLGCLACTAYLSQMRATVALLGRLEPDDLPAAVLEELVELYRRVTAS
jgi:anti-sigma factor RsiW